MFAHLGPVLERSNSWAVPVLVRTVVRTVGQVLERLRQVLEHLAGVRTPDQVLEHVFSSWPGVRTVGQVFEHLRQVLEHLARCSNT